MASQPRHRRDRPIKRVGTSQEMLDLVQLITGDASATMKHPIAIRLLHLAEVARTEEAAAHQSVPAKPALDQLSNAVDLLQRLGRTLHDLPAELAVLLEDQLRLARWQDDALPRLEGALQAVHRQVAPDGAVKRGPGRLAERLYGDAVDFAVQQLAQMLAEARGPDALSSDINGPLHEATAAFWAYATGQEEPPNLTRKVQREAEPARLDHRARELDHAADELLRVALRDPTRRDTRKGSELREEAFHIRAQAHALRTA